MNTAKTLQLLDANNNNISPATCVDSLYFEKTDNGTTYRMALKNRIIVAGDNLNTTSTISNNPADLRQIKIPYFYVSPASGTGNIYQIQTTTLNIGEAIYNAFTNSSSNYITQTKGDSRYLRTDGTNYMNGHFDVSTGNGLFRVYNNVISFKDGSFTLDASTENNFQMKGSSNIQNFSINSKNVYVGVNRGNTLDTSNIYIGSRDTSSVSVATNLLDISVNYANVLGTYNASLGSYGLVDVFSLDSSINIKTHSADSNINIDSSNITLYNINFNNPIGLTSSTNNKYVLYYDTDTPSQMQWSNIPVLKISSYGFSTIHSYMEDLNVDTSIYLKRMCFTGSDPAYVEPIMQNNLDTDNTIYLRSVHDRNGRNVQLKGSNANDYIYFSTINGQSIFNVSTGENINLVTPSDVSCYSMTYCSTATGDDNTNYYIFGDTDTVIKAHEAGTTGALKDTSLNLQYINSLYYRTNGAVYASAFYATSDERLKTDITVPDIESVNAPEVKKFAWKDTSAYTYGFIAQELEQKGYSELVDTDSNGYKKVNYDAALSLAVASLQKENKELRERLERIEKLLLK